MWKTIQWKCTLRPTLIDKNVALHSDVHVAGSRITLVRKYHKLPVLIISNWITLSFVSIGTCAFQISTWNWSFGLRSRARDQTSFWATERSCRNPNLARSWWLLFYVYFLLCYLFCFIAKTRITHKRNAFVNTAKGRFLWRRLPMALSDYPARWAGMPQEREGRELE